LAYQQGLYLDFQILTQLRETAAVAEFEWTQSLVSLFDLLGDINDVDGEIILV